MKLAMKNRAMKLFAGVTLTAGTVMVAAAVAPVAVAADQRPTQTTCTSYRDNNQFPLRLCDQSHAVVIAQFGLRTVEPDLAADGRFGTNTHDALLRYQQQFGLEADGLIDAQTWEALTWRMVDEGLVLGRDENLNGRLDPWEATLPATGRPNTCDEYRSNDHYPLWQCNKGAAVEVLQRGLRVVAPDLAIDGYFGPRTSLALFKFKRQYQLEYEEFVGPDTWVAITWSYVTGTDTDGNGRIDPYEVTPPSPQPDPPTPSDPSVCSSYRPDYAYPIQLCGSGEGVRVAQLALRDNGAEIAVDGYFGPRTQAAVGEFQERNLLPVTGEIDQQTWVYLIEGDGNDPNCNGVTDPWELGGAPTPPECQR